MSSDADVHQDGARHFLVIERRLPHSSSKVWRALTEREFLRQWFPADVHGVWEVGAPLRFEFLHGEDKGLSDEELRGEVLQVEPERLLEFSWGEGIIRCELEPDGEGTRLRLSELMPDASWGARNAAGWEMCLENLDSVIQGVTVAKFAWDAWRPRFERYRKKFEAKFGPQNEPAEDLRDDG